MKIKPCCEIHYTGLHDNGEWKDNGLMILMWSREKEKHILNAELMIHPAMAAGDARPKWKGFIVWGT